MDFNSVELGDHSENACTPAIEKDFIGMKINAPTVVRSGEDQFAVCGTYRFTAEYAYSFSSIHRAVVLVAVDAQRHDPYACTIGVPSSIPSRPKSSPPPQDPDWMTDHYIRRYFNVNMLRFMTQLPRRTATYYVYALIEDHISNVCRVDFKA